MKKLLSVVLSITILLMLSTAVFADDAGVKHITVGVDASFAPFEYYEDGVLTGFDIDLMNCIGEKIGYGIEYVDMTFDTLIPAVMSGEVDCAISAITVTDERKNLIDYSDIYVSTYATSGETPVSVIEEYAIAFPKNTVEKARVLEAAGEEAVYTLINEAIQFLQEDGTVKKLMNKYEIIEDNHAGVGPVVHHGESIIEAVEVTDSTAVGHGDLAAPSDWAMEYVSKADRIGMTNAFKVPWASNITREQFCQLAYNMLDKAAAIEWQNSPSDVFDDTEHEMVVALYHAGIIKGKADTVFAPDDEITREEAATILDRIGQYTNLVSTELYYIFEDENEISDWAADAVQRVCNLGVMQGVGNNIFNPQGGYTVEQAVTTLVRLFERISDDTFAYMTFADKMNANMPKEQNYMFSPLSVKMALMMAANGATGETQQEILAATNVENLENYSENIKLMLAEYSQSDLLKLTVANSIWLNSDKTAQRFSQAYADKLADIFRATSEVVTNQTAAKDINGWVNEKTEGKIPTIVTEENADFWAMLVNAVYFKGRWQSEFNKGATKEDIFTSRDGEQATMEFMNRTAWMRYAKANEVTIVELPYLTREDVFNENGEYVETKKLEGVNISMYLMMSDGSFNPEEVLSNTEMTSKYIALSVPKFKVEYSTSLNDILKTIGIQKAFAQDAEFNEMFDSGSMWIDSTIHKTYISVDEEGTEAAAVTSAGMAGLSLPPEPIEVRYNKPFTFVIKDNINGEILFMGEYAFAE